MRWGVTTAVSFVPFLITCFVVLVLKQLTWDVLSRQPQLLFVALVLGSSALYDILTCAHVRRGLFLQFVSGLIMLVAILSAVLYGMHFAILNITGPEGLSMPLFFETALAFMGASVVGTAIIQYKIAENEPPSYA